MSHIKWEKTDIQIRLEYFLFSSILYTEGKNRTSSHENLECLRDPRPSISRRINHTFIPSIENILLEYCYWTPMREYFKTNFQPISTGRSSEVTDRDFLLKKIFLSFYLLCFRQWKLTTILRILIKQVSCEIDRNIVPMKINQWARANNCVHSVGKKNLRTELFSTAKTTNASMLDFDHHCRIWWNTI